MLRCKQLGIQEDPSQKKIKILKRLVLLSETVYKVIHFSKCLATVFKILKKGYNTWQKSNQTVTGRRKLLQLSVFITRDTTLIYLRKIKWIQVNGHIHLACANWPYQLTTRTKAIATPSTVCQLIFGYNALFMGSISRFISRY
jgi:hypothetical protein